ARIRFQQAAQHPDGGGLAAAIGAEKAPHLSFGHGDIDVIDRDLAPEALGQAMHVDRKFSHGLAPASLPVLELALLVSLPATLQWARPAAPQNHLGRALRL